MAGSTAAVRKPTDAVAIRRVAQRARSQGRRARASDSHPASATVLTTNRGPHRFVGRAEQQCERTKGRRVEQRREVQHDEPQNPKGGEACDERPRQDGDGPDGKQFKGVGAGLIGLSNQREKGAGQKRKREQGGFAGEAVDADAPKENEAGDDRDFGERELGEAIEGLPVEGEEEDHGRREHRRAGEEQQTIDEMPPCGGRRQHLGGLHGLAQPAFANETLVRPIEDFSSGRV
jgi:hypothetical protein